MADRRPQPKRSAELVAARPLCHAAARATRNGIRLGNKPSSAMRPRRRRRSCRTARVLQCRTHNLDGRRDPPRSSARLGSPVRRGRLVVDEYLKSARPRLGRRRIRCGDRPVQPPTDGTTRHRQHDQRQGRGDRPGNVAASSAVGTPTTVPASRPRACVATSAGISRRPALSARPRTGRPREGGHEGLHLSAPAPEPASSESPQTGWSTW